jgi:ParB-like chromosome segregation protein Spo0J
MFYRVIWLPLDGGEGSMVVKELVEVGGRIPVEKFRVSALNVRAGEAFGEAEEDKRLIAQLRRGRIVGPFKARPEGEGYGVFVGRRRFLAKKEGGARYFVVGADCLVEEVSDEDAREASLIENLEILRKEMDPITRAKTLNEVVSFSAAGLRGTARRLGISASTLSEWLKVLELIPRIQEALAKGLLFYTDALMIARMKLGTDLQDKLATVLETEGPDALKRELMRVSKGKMKRGVPKGVYIILRATLDKRYKPDVELYEKLTELAEAKNRKLDEYCKWVLTEHVKSV